MEHVFQGLLHSRISISSMRAWGIEMRFELAATAATMFFLAGCSTQYGETNLSGLPQEASRLPNICRPTIARSLRMTSRPGRIIKA